MDKQKLIWYVIAPLGSALVMVLMYFSGVYVLRQIVSPVIEGMYGNSQREFGLLENLQNVYLLITLGFMVHAVKRKTTLLERGAFFFGALVTLFLLLEEMDYGLHYYEWAMGIGADEAVKERNWHNQGDRTDMAKRLMDAGMVLLFAVIPLVFSNAKNRYLRYIVASRWSIATLIGSLLVSRFAHLLNDMGLSNGNNTNISEFREYINYWLIMIFVYDVVYKRSLGDNADAADLVVAEPDGEDIG